LRYNSIAARFSRRVPPANFKTIYYSDLVDSPQEVIGDICQFLDGLRSPDNWDVDPKRLHIIGNPMRLTFESIDKKRAHEWKGKIGKDTDDYIRLQMRKVPWYDQRGLISD